MSSLCGQPQTAELCDPSSLTSCFHSEDSGLSTRVFLAEDSIPEESSFDSTSHQLCDDNMGFLLGRPGFCSSLDGSGAMRPHLASIFRLILNRETAAS